MGKYYKYKPEILSPDFNLWGFLQFEMLLSIPFLMLLIETSLKSQRLSIKSKQTNVSSF